MTGLHPDVAIRVLKRIRPVFNREWDGDKHSYKYQLKVYERNHDRLEKDRGIKTKTPFKSYYCLPYKDRLSALRGHNLADSTTLAVYDAILSYVDRGNKEGSYVSGWTMVISQVSIAKRAGVNVDCANKTMLKLVEVGLLERKPFNNKYRYRVTIWKDALDRLKNEARQTDKGEPTDSDMDNRELLERFIKEPPPSNVTSMNQKPTKREAGDFDSYFKGKSRRACSFFQ